MPVPGSLSAPESPRGSSTTLYGGKARQQGRFELLRRIGTQGTSPIEQQGRKIGTAGGNPEESAANGGWTGRGSRQPASWQWTQRRPDRFTRVNARRGLQSHQDRT